MKLSRHLRALAAAAVLSAGAVSAQAQGFVAARSNVSFGNALADATLVVAQKDGRWLARTAGDSMLPFFGADSIAVIQRIDATRLREGMIAVYRNADGEQVAHRVVGRTATGWRVQGYNNDRADSTVVDGSNLLGVVYATFHTAGRDTGNFSAPASFEDVPVIVGAPAK